MLSVFLQCRQTIHSTYYIFYIWSVIGKEQYMHRRSCHSPLCLIMWVVALPVKQEMQMKEWLCLFIFNSGCFSWSCLCLSEEGFNFLYYFTLFASPHLCSQLPLSVIYISLCIMYSISFGSIVNLNNDGSKSLIRFWWKHKLTGLKLMLLVLIKNQYFHIF